MVNTFIKNKCFAANICALLLALFFIFSQPVFAENKILNKTDELNQVSQQIQGLQTSLTQDRNQQGNLQEDLQQTEIQIGKISNILGKSSVELKKQNIILAQLQHQQGQYRDQYNQQESALANDFRVVYMLGGHDYIKLFLSQDNSAELSRMLVYYRYINAERLGIMSKLRQLILSLTANQQQIETHTQQLQQLQVQQKQNQQDLKFQLQQRTHVLIQVKNSIQSKAEILNNLLANKRALEQLVTKLKQTTNANFPQPTVSFMRMRGKLMWPTQGSLSQHFGSKIEGSDMTATNVLINAPDQQPVRAIYPGRIVFSDWLRGLGLLVIIDHGNGFMSLYGHNHSLYKKLGDYVKAGDMIATVGKSGGYDQTGLYFQIRDNGSPVNPELWCKQ